MRLLLTETAHRRFGARVAVVAPSADFVRMQDDGTLLDAAGRAVAWDEAEPDVAWATADLFGAGAPLRPFFGLTRRANGLRWFQSPGAGIDHPIFAELVGRGVRLTTSHVTHIPIAEFVVRAVLDHFQAADRWRQAQSERAWRTHDFREVLGSTWLVVGLGAIGSAVAVRAGAFGAHVIGVRRQPRGDEPVGEMLGPEQVLGALPRADVVVLAAPSTPETHHLVDHAFLGRMREGSVLVNIARGALVDEAALLAALDRGVPEVAVLDVVATEPLPADSPLWVHPRVVVTPHNAAGGTGRYERAAELFLENLGRWLRDEPLRNEVGPADVPGVERHR